MKEWCWVLEKWLDKVLIFVLCTGVYVQALNIEYMVVPIIIAVIIDCIIQYTENKYVKNVLFIAYLFISLFYTPLIFFIPLLCYEFNEHLLRYVAGVVAVIVIECFLGVKSAPLLLIIVAVSFIMSKRQDQLEKERLKYMFMQDDSKEKLFSINKKYKDLLERQDYQMNLAALSERNRIARDIHDSVGHILSRSILQVGAMITVSKDETQKEQLTLLKDSLSQGMDSIRSSLHNLYDTSINLSTEMQKIVDNFTFCELKYICEIDNNPDKKITYNFMAIAKEGLTNIQKHSKATSAKLTVRELPAFYVLSIEDNGVGISDESQENGIGLSSVRQRAEDIGGVLNIVSNKGLKIYLSVSKEVIENEHSNS